MNCNFCLKQYANKKGLSNHIVRCPKNPNRRIQVLTEDGRKRLSEKVTANNIARYKNSKFREKHRKAMQDAVKKYPNSYNSSNRGRTKQIVFEGIKFQGKWELEFYLWCKRNNVKVEKPNAYFEYEWKGKRKYFPDFFLPEKNLYIEIKGYQTERDEAKWKCFPHTLRIVKQKDIELIRKDLWGL